MALNFFEYIDTYPVAFQRDYIDTGLVNVQGHREFPLDIYSYGRRAVFDNVWDKVTSKCRGIIVHRTTGEVIARPFEKFHNFGSQQAFAQGLGPDSVIFQRQPVVWEKLDGFMSTLYTWEGKDYLASKGSFHSVHAKWATAWYRRTVGDRGLWPQGWTPVFEGLHPDLRIVVDYGKREGLVLLAVIHNETGTEIHPYYVEQYAKTNKLETPKVIDMTWQRAREESMHEYRDSLGCDEGYVLTWYNPFNQQPAIRLKMKFIDYLRLHRMVCGVSPKRIWEALASNSSEIQEWTDKNNGTPWFEAFVGKWVRALRDEHNRRLDGAKLAYAEAINKLGVQPGPTDSVHNLTPEQSAVRKAFASEIAGKEFSSAAFKLLDREDPSGVIWKQVKEMTNNISPMRDAQFT